MKPKRPPPHSYTPKLTAWKSFPSSNYISCEMFACIWFFIENISFFTAYNLKHSRDLVRAISKKVKTIPFHPLRPRYPSTLTSSPHSTSPHPLTPTIMPSSSHFSAGTFDRVSGILPAINRRTSVAVGYLIDRQSL